MKGKTVLDIIFELRELQVCDGENFPRTRLNDIDGGVSRIIMGKPWEVKSSGN